MTRMRLALASIALLLAGCSWIPFFGSEPKKLDPPPSVANTAGLQVSWRVPLGARSAPGMRPDPQGDLVYVSTPDGAIAAFEAATGRALWRTSIAPRLSAGVGASGKLAVAATPKGEVLAFASEHKLWTGKVSSEVFNPPLVADDTVVVVAGDGRVFGLGANDGQRRWVYERSLPALIVRNYAGGTSAKGVFFMGTPGGKLVALDAGRGTLVWEATIATPKGATELERIADVTSRPVVDDRYVCAAAFQGRVACFERERGTLVWSRDISSAAGVALDGTQLYVTDDKGSVQALDRDTGASVWKQDRLAGRRPAAPQVLGQWIIVSDAEGIVYALSRSDGALAAAVPIDGSPLVAQPVRNGDAVLVLTRNGTLARFDAR